MVSAVRDCATLCSGRGGICANAASEIYKSNPICSGASAGRELIAETVTPTKRMPRRGGNMVRTKSTLTLRNTSRLRTGAANVRLRAPVPHIVGHGLDRSFDGRRLRQIRGKSGFGSGGFPRPIRCDSPVVLATRDRVIPGSGLAEMARQDFERLPSEIGTGENAEPVHFIGGDRAHTVEFVNRQILD